MKIEVPVTLHIEIESSDGGFRSAVFFGKTCLWMSGGYISAAAAEAAQRQAIASAIFKR